MALPQVPPRPSRSQFQPSSTTTTMEAPKVPPRPTPRRQDRSESPHRDSFARSPLNEAPFAMAHGGKSGGIYDNGNASSSSLGLPARPPSVTLPSIGQEGSEYADIIHNESEKAPDALSTSPTQTRNVGSDLPLHAPKPSLSTSNAKARIATVTRTESTHAAAAGIGKVTTPVPGDDKDPDTRPLKNRRSSSSTRSSVSTERPSSVLADSEHGIPEIGQRVPMYPNAGDVQAPSPSPFPQQSPAAIGFHNDGSKPRHHGRTRSGREVFQPPPGSYGLHGHGLASPDKFEKAWYDKHPEALVKEEGGQYGPGIGGSRGEWAMSSEDLNKIVRGTASRGAGLGTSPNIVGLPNEQIGYIASEEYTSRLNSPRPHSGVYHSKAHSNHSQTHIDSPLRKQSFPVESGQDDLNKSRETHSGLKAPSEHALESENEDDDVIHVDAPDVRTSKYLGNGYDPPTEDLGPRGGNTDAEGGWIEEKGYGVPILASDEVEPGTEYLQPAVAPVQEHRGSTYYSGVDSDAFYQSGHRHSSRSESAASSRPTSRPVSIHGTLPGLARFTSHDDREDQHTPLEEIEEYEPLFPEDEGKPYSAHGLAYRFKQRPDIKRRFPSQDIWEDTPNSLQLQAEVTTPEPITEQKAPADTKATAVFEPPETEAARKGEVNEEGKAQLLPREERLAKSSFKPHIVDDMQRPNMKQRFPSRDIWEDSPDSAHMTTTVETPEEEEVKSPVDEGLIAGAVVHTSGRPDAGNTMGAQVRDGATISAPAGEKPSLPPRPATLKLAEEPQSLDQKAVPSIPPRPQRTRQMPPANVPSLLSKGSAESSPVESPVDSRKAPVLPDRAKPHLPSRPRPATKDSSEGVPLAKTLSANSTGSASDSAPAAAAALKPKPAIPSRPGGGKIAALKAGFMSDLDKRLQLGPQAPSKTQEKEVEEHKEEEKAPLADARKGRAKGPARRKPAASPAARESASSTEAELEIVQPWTMWHISTEGDGALEVIHAMKPTGADETTTSAEVEEEPANGQSLADPDRQGESSSPQIPEPTSSEPQPAADKVQPTSDAVGTSDRSIGAESPTEVSAKFTVNSGNIARPEGEDMGRIVAEIEGEHHTEQAEV